MKVSLIYEPTMSFNHGCDDLNGNKRIHSIC